MLPTLKIATGVMLPDNDQWQFRFNIESESSNRLYVIAQNKKKRYWACSCPGWKRFRRCKHLQAVGLPANEKPFEVNIIHN
ncbi:hypothetical protein MTO98_09530 [Mucilaginibacter sp. SMC90]|uniref:hypothetical protein n=1 Tax=Mucilaginibacter sp. SMC90 TaxID=2929803 RepID=UPI001FB44B2D|nr:hypothetical protein [Mucilaginibacter sp. SMC90]UOE51318.1 hypothetical protein MTO98_09530 [Mucilaginibacter sp. SMC90]